jgi:hypothetical protein
MPYQYNFNQSIINHNGGKRWDDGKIIEYNPGRNDS